MNAPSAPPMPPQQGQQLFRLATGGAIAGPAPATVPVAATAATPVGHTDDASAQYLQEMVQSMSHRTSAPDAQFFGAFDAVSAELGRLQTIVNAGAGGGGSAQEQQNLRQRLMQIQQSQIQMQHRHATLATKGQEREARIRRNSQGLLHSTVLMPQTWFRGGVEGIPKAGGA